MAFNYARPAATAVRMVAKYGRPITLLASSRTPASASMPWKGSSAPHTEADPTEATAMGAFVGLSLKDLGWTETNEPGDLIKRGAQYVLVAPAGITPAGTDITTYDAILDDTAIWAIVQVHTLKPGDTALLHAIEVTQ